MCTFLSFLLSSLITLKDVIMHAAQVEGWKDRQVKKKKEKENFIFILFFFRDLIIDNEDSEGGQTQVREITKKEGEKKK